MEGSIPNQIGQASPCATTTPCVTASSVGQMTQSTFTTTDAPAQTWEMRKMRNARPRTAPITVATSANSADTVGEIAASNTGLDSLGLSSTTRGQFSRLGYEAAPCARSAPLMACTQHSISAINSVSNLTSMMNNLYSTAWYKPSNNLTGHKPASNSTFTYAPTSNMGQTNRGFHNFDPVSLYNSQTCDQPYASVSHLYGNAKEILNPPNIHAAPRSACTTQGPPAGQTTSAFNSVQWNSTLSPSHIAARQVITKDLPHFSGDPEEWPLFYTNYMQSTERCDFSDQENLIRLQKCLKGTALEAVRGKLMMPATVNLAMETLRMLFGRPGVIHEALQRKVRDVPAVRIERLETLVTLALSVQNYRATMQAMGLNEYLNDPTLLNDLIGKLPGEMKLEWGRQRLSLTRVDICAFDEWLFGLASCASQVTPINMNRLNSKAEQRGRRERLLVHNVAHSNQETSPTKSSSPPPHRSSKCIKCEGCHGLTDCDEFKALGRQSRWQFVKDKKLCVRCFKNHSIRRCKSNKLCGIDGCRLVHNPLLHRRSEEPRDLKNTPEKLEYNAVCLHQKQCERVLFRYILVTLHANGRALDTVALIDEGASCTLLDKSLAQKLMLTGPTEELCLRWTGDITQQEPTSKIVSLEISARESDVVKYSLHKVRTLANLDLPQQSLQMNVIEKRQHLKSLPILPYSYCKAGILIGLDHAKLSVPLETRESKDDDLIATRCKLGWSVYGRDGYDQLTEARLMHICPCKKDGDLDVLMRSYFSVEAVGVSPYVKPLVSTEDKRAYNIMEKMTRYIAHEKRWETGLLWRYDKVDLPDSYAMARRRLECLEKKMNKNADLKVYLLEPMFTVMNVNKGKRRLVWDAAAKVEGISLNDVLLKGPDLLKSLVGILIRFREKPVALCGDIREMFHQIRVVKEDQIAQQFLWRNGDPTRDPEVYAMVVMTFGASCSPSLAIYVKDKNAKRFMNRFPAVISAITQNTFVDDWLLSVENEDEMLQLATTVKHIHSEGGFEMRNWLSNSKRVLLSLTGQTEIADKSFEETNDAIEKVLGMWWRPCTDELLFVQ